MFPYVYYEVWEKMPDGKLEWHTSNNQYGERISTPGECVIAREKARRDHPGRTFAAVKITNEELS